MILGRTSPRNIYLNLFDGAHFHWKSLKAWHIAKRTCLTYVWTAIFPWSYCYLNFRYCACFKQEVVKLYSIDSLWNARSSHQRCSVRTLLKKWLCVKWRKSLKFWTLTSFKKKKKIKLKSKYKSYDISKVVWLIFRL